MIEKPSRRSIRIKGWDYRSAGLYFVTICTHRRENIFEDVRLREIAANAWAYIPEHETGQGYVESDGYGYEGVAAGILGTNHSH